MSERARASSGTSTLRLRMRSGWRPRDSIGRFLLLEEPPDRPRALALRLEARRPVDVVGSASRARVLLASRRPYIGYVFDLGSPEGEGLRLLEQVRRTYDAQTPALVVAGPGFSSGDLARLGAAARCLPRPAGGADVPPFLAGLGRFCRDALGYERETLGAYGALFDLSDGELTPAQMDVALLAAEGLGRDEIAEELGVARSTVGAHISQVLAKCGLSGRRLATFRRVLRELGRAPPSAASARDEGPGSERPP